MIDCSALSMFPINHISKEWYLPVNLGYNTVTQDVNLLWNTPQFPFMPPALRKKNLEPVHFSHLSFSIKVKVAGFFFWSPVLFYQDMKHSVEPIKFSHFTFHSVLDLAK